MKTKMDTNAKVAEKAMDLDDVLVNELGQFGRFQLYNILLVAAPMVFSALLNEYVFSAGAIPHRCHIPECDPIVDEAIYSPEWILNAVPKVGEGFSSCWRYESINGVNTTIDYCPAEAFNRSKMLDCDYGFVYARQNSVVYEFDLGCKEWLRTLAGTLNSIGTLLVMPISGFISDRYGRRVTLVVSLFNVALIGLIRAFSVNYPMYLTMQLLQTALGGGTFSTAYIFATELVGPKYRMAVGVTCSSMFALGQVVLGGVAWLVPDWRHMTLILFVPCFIFISYYWILAESVRWLLSKRKYEEAREVLEKVAKVNGKQISDSSMQALTSHPTPILKKTSSKSNLIASVFKSSVLLRRVCTTPVWWISTTFIYYGLSINSTSLSDTMYLNYMLTGAIELPGFFTALFLVNRLGRKPTLSGGYFLCAACNIAFAFIPVDKTIIRLCVYLLGKYGIAMVFTSLYLFTSELYPTEYRHTLLAFSSMVGRIGSIVAPLTPVLREYWLGLPSILFGCMGLISGLLILTQPETLGSKLPDTLAEAENLGTPESKLKQVS
ncbi:solute carrier family 22 member 3-like [Pectinophora gossypiella]|uniref:solute carrier family 22 member 3-like n=1 Tax=Pectinophora gossypiella TaxID=13191 RepID=UPI00214DF173|nr:solute carrier family 22 member 3-like [Pectinophora gossypiella]XP_049865252.1 solute carrier family 22 member 3-like [Pectinophora gossypiella]XP_049865253.1 solute carrier family 22 member 3-like [Pectinophora gossypiella]XP_049865255.1 solute carrier family 22 member 3-like [Pectinophora gossypiella]XP_049865256.1 solute carrier family 22 member 3-like [Pectinophora gossypiella]